MVLSGSIIPLPLFPDWAQTHPRRAALSRADGHALSPLYGPASRRCRAWRCWRTKLAWSAGVLVLLGRWLLARGRGAWWCREAEADATRLGSTGRYVGVSMRSQMQYRASFIMLSIGHFSVHRHRVPGPVGALRPLWHICRAGRCPRWRSSTAWSISPLPWPRLARAASTPLPAWCAAAISTASCCARAARRSRSPGASSSSCASGASRQGLVVLICGRVQCFKSPGRLPRILLRSALSWAERCLFAGLFVLQATLCFWTIESLEIMNTMTYGGVETAQYPADHLSRLVPQVLHLCRAAGRRDLLSRPGHPGPQRSPGLASAGSKHSPLIGAAAFLVVALQVWQVGVRHYHSTGS